ncbi:MAG TPA: DUF2063 domain-containing protein, partial [Casimicrobiaceae bacterium]|nr:DUF2063 domain-containing protein [Casimicrobiaceae bacterium]
LTGTPFFRAAVDAYVVAVPSTCGDLNVYGDQFGDFLAGYPPARTLPYLSCVARLEWAIDEANRAGRSPGNSEQILARLSAVSAARLPAVRLRLAPSCRLIASRYPVLRIWQTNQPDFAGDRRVELTEGAEHVLVRRDAHGVSLERLARGEHAWLSALASDAPLGEAIERAQCVDCAFDLQSTLLAHLVSRTFADVSGA